MKMRLEQQLKKIESLLDEENRNKLCNDAILLDPDQLRQIMSFYRLVLHWMARIIKVPLRSNLSNLQFQMPLPDPVPEAFAAMPVIYTLFKFINTNLIAFN